MSEHPITPPPELVQQWWDGTHGALYEFEAVVTQSARWGADQELEACIDWISVWHGLEHPELLIELLRAARRPKPPSLKEQALDALENLNGECLLEGFECPEKVATIRRALESLPS
jgi:hypothetical protein